MTIAGILKNNGIKIAPRDIAKKIVANIKVSNEDKDSIIEKLEVAGPGFINIFLDASIFNLAIFSIKN